MLSVNPFAVAGASLPAGFLQGFLVVMVAGRGGRDALRHRPQG